MDQLPDRPAALHRHRQTWTLYWRDRNLRFHRYDLLEPSPQVRDLLTEIDRDPTAIFWADTNTTPPLSPPQLEWGQLTPSQRGQFRLTMPHSWRAEERISLSVPRPGAINIVTGLPAS